MDKKYMMDCVYNQLSLDYNCKPDDFLKDGLVFTEAKENEGRRPFPFLSPRLEIISMGHGTIINASDDILPYAYKEFTGKTREEIFDSPIVYGVYPYFLPDLSKIRPIKKPNDFAFTMLEKEDIKRFYSLYGTSYGMEYDEAAPIPEVLMIYAKFEDHIAGIVKAKADSKTMWSIDVDVLHPFRGKGLAAPMVNMLTLEIMNRGYVPYYFAAVSNVLSTHVAVRAGFIPAWVHSYKTRINNMIGK